MELEIKIWDCQAQKYFSEGKVFKTKEKIKEQLINFHSIDCDENFLKQMKLSELLEFGSWELHNSIGEVVLIN